MTDLQRIRKVLNWLIFSDYAINDNDLAVRLGYTKSSFSQIVNGKVPLSDKFIDKICALDNNINKVWIKDGTGTIFISDIAHDKRCNNCEAFETIILEMKEQISNLKARIDDLNKLIDAKNEIIMMHKSKYASDNISDHIGVA